MFEYRSKTVFNNVPEIIKILFMLAITILAFVFNSFQSLGILLLLVFILLIMTRYRFKEFTKLFFALLPFIILTMVALSILFSKESKLLFFISVVVMRIFVIFLNFALFTRITDMFAVARLLKRMKMPRTVYIAIYSLLRFLPELEYEYIEIKNMQRLRGIRLRNGLIKYLKAHFLPMIYVLLDRADELSIALYLREKNGKSL